jgi:hypothetical protein
MTSLKLDPVNNTAIFIGFNPASIGLGNISQNSQGKITLDADTMVWGQLTVFPKFEVKNNSNGCFYYPWNETNKYSSRLDMWSEDSTKEYEISIFRDTYCSNAKAGVAIYRPNQSNVINAYIAAIGNSYVAANNGNFGVGTSNPAYKLDVVGSSRFNGNIGFFGKTPIAQQTGGAKTASATFSTNEQTMLQTVYNALRNFGFLS